MALINKDGKIIANRAQVMKVFGREEDFNFWMERVPETEKDLRSFSIVKKYNTSPPTGKVVSCLINGERFGVRMPPDYFGIEAIGGGTVNATIRYPSDGWIEYSQDSGGTWVRLASEETSPSSKKILFRGNMPRRTFLEGENNTGYFEVANTLGDAKVGSYGNILRLLEPEGKVDALGLRAFESFFQNNSSLVTAPQLPATVLSEQCYQGMFYGCTSLVTPPELPATTLTSHCYFSMFTDCTSLTTAPKLPATTLTEWSYYNMFYGCASLASVPNLSATTLADSSCQGMFIDCTSLVTPPELPATTLANQCYYSMFNGCTSLTTAPKLPATILADYSCYSQMFQGCTKLTTPPELPATTLTENCYDGMFENCTSLTTAPELPVTDLAGGCYQGMFQGCSSLTTPPKLPATTLATFCYKGMFLNCTSLITPPELPATTLVDYCYVDMFKGCTSLTSVALRPTATIRETTTNFMYRNVQNLFSTSADSVYSIPHKNGFIPTMYDFYGTGTKVNTMQTIYGKAPTARRFSSIPDPEEISTNCFTINCDNEPTTVTFDYPESGTLEYFENSTWRPFPSGSSTPEQYSHKFRGDMPNNTFAQRGRIKISDIAETSKVTFGGTILALLKPDGVVTELGDYAFAELFKDCKAITTPPDLPMTNLSRGCYKEMFKDCSNLTTPPSLPATTVSEKAYYGMFENCSNLTTPPSLPATELNPFCYGSMFKKCTKLTSAPQLPATTMVKDCYRNMFSECTSLKKAPELPAENLAETCYAYMFHGCTSLTTAPSLPARELKTYCYSGIFAECTGLKELAKVRSTNITGECDEMYRDVFGLFTDTRSGDFVVPYKSTSSRDVIGFCGENYRIVPGEKIYGKTPPFDYLTFTSSECMNITPQWTNTGSIQYSLDNAATWSEATPGVPIAAGQKVKFKGTMPTNALNTTSDTLPWILEGADITANGDVTTLLNPKGQVQVLAENAFRGLFDSQEGLVRAPRLPSTEIGPFAYANMFSNTNITRPPRLPATTLSEGCYMEMFSSNNSLIVPPRLPAMDLAKSCYKGMLSSCSAITEAPVLPATKLAEYCYAELFSGCKALENPPSLPATSLVEGCYQKMFANCSQLSRAAEWSITEISDACNQMYENMFWTFSGDKSEEFTAPYAVVGEGSLTRFCGELPDLSPGATFYGKASSNDFLTFTSPEDMKITPYWNNTGTIQYCLGEGDKWQDAAPLKEIAAGQKIKFKGAMATNTLYLNGLYGSWSLIGKDITASGDVTTLLRPEGNVEVLEKGAFNNLFYGGSALIKAPKLPSLTMGESCYVRMFANTSISEPPTLPATTLAKNCYQLMFSNCALLTKAPELDVPYLEESCYEGMFENCRSLSIVQEVLAADEAPARAYRTMFKNCSALKNPPNISASRRLEDCFANMFEGCTSLTRHSDIGGKTIFPNESEMYLGVKNIFSMTPDDTFSVEWSYNGSADSMIFFDDVVLAPEERFYSKP